MYKIIIFSDSYKHFDKSIKEYEKRLKFDIEVIKLKPSKKNNISEIIDEETIILKEKLEKIKWYKILLHIEWKILSTQKLYELIEKKFLEFWNIVFVVWWAYWIDLNKIDKIIDFKLSISEMTFPHNMAYLILLEQIYRIINIKKWTWYNH